MALIGIFDTGLGGRYAAQRLKRLRPHDEFIVVDDYAHVPYGSRTDDEIFELTNNAIRPLVMVRCDVIVIACNTATTTAIEKLRATHPGVPFVGFEPMVKTAARTTKTNKIAILATPVTLRSQRYKQLKRKWAAKCRVFEPDCSTWATLIENNTFDPVEAEQCIIDLIANDVDVVALACTHYIYLRDRLQDLAGTRATVIQPMESVNSQIANILENAR